VEPPEGTPPVDSLSHDAAPVAVEAVIRPDPDAREVAKAQAGDMEAFERLVQRNGQRVYRTLLGITGHEADAEDGMQNAFVKAWQHIGEFHGQSKFSSWLMRIAMNEGLEILRRRRSKGRKALVEWKGEDEERFNPRSTRPWEEDPERQYSRAEIREIVEKKIMKLPAKYRVAVMLRDLEGLDTQEAAAALGLNVATLKTRLLRGRLMLREALAPYFGKKRRTAGGAGDGGL
jgi:RNA polymerase sigma-70 factor, ECF subfamily